MQILLHGGKVEGALLRILGGIGVVGSEQAIKHDRTDLHGVRVIDRIGPADEQTRIGREERLLKGALGRIRDVRVGPDGFIYLLTDESRGVLARLEP